MIKMGFRFWVKPPKMVLKNKVCYQLSIEILKIDVPIAIGIWKLLGSILDFWDVDMLFRKTAFLVRLKTWFTRERKQLIQTFSFFE